MKRNKRGVSLIVLVITIIVMIILAAAVMISLSNTGIIGKANDAVDASNLKEVQHLATLAWAEAYIDTADKTDEGERLQEIEKVVKDAVAEIDKTGSYTVTVTMSGVTVALAGEDVSVESGLYDANGNMLASWDELTNDYGMDIMQDYTSDTYQTNASSLHYVLTNNVNLSSGVELVIDDSVTSIGDYALANTNLTNIKIPDSVTSIGAGALFMNESLVSIEFPSSVTYIGEECFFSCHSFNSLTYTGTVEQWNAITLGTDWNGIDRGLDTPLYVHEVSCNNGTVTLQ